jgi:hypothetical protein
VYVVLSYTTDFDQVRYPLVLHKKTYRPAEWEIVARSLRAENDRLQRPIHRLESQLCELTAATRRMEEDKDRTIRELRGRIVRLEAEHKRVLSPPMERGAGSWRAGLGPRRTEWRRPVNVPEIMARRRLGEVDADWRRIRALINERYRY